MIVGGVRYWTTREATDQLQVSAERLRDWVRRSRIAGHTARAAPADCPTCRAGRPGFPHVDPPVRAGRLAAYVAEQLLAAELYTGTSTRTGRIRGGA